VVEVQVLVFLLPELNQLLTYFNPHITRVLSNITGTSGRMKAWLYLLSENCTTI